MLFSGISWKDTKASVVKRYKAYNQVVTYINKGFMLVRFLWQHLKWLILLKNCYTHIFHTIKMCNWDVWRVGIKSLLNQRKIEKYQINDCINRENKNYKYPTPYSSHTYIILGQGFGYYSGKWGGGVNYKKFLCNLLSNYLDSFKIIQCINNALNLIFTINKILCF